MEPTQPTPVLPWTAAEDARLLELVTPLRSSPAGSLTFAHWLMLTHSFPGRTPAAIQTHWWLLSHRLSGPKRKPNKSLAFHQHSPKPTPSLSPWKKLKNPARRGANLGAAQIKWTGDDDQRLISLAEAQKKELGVHDWEALVGHFKRRTACALSQRWHKTLRPKRFGMEPDGMGDSDAVDGQDDERGLMEEAHPDPTYHNALPDIQPSPIATEAAESLASAHTHSSSAPTLQKTRKRNWTKAELATLEKLAVTSMSWGAVGLQCGGRDGKAAERKWRKISRIRQELITDFTGFNPSEDTWNRSAGAAPAAPVPHITPPAILGHTKPAVIDAPELAGLDKVMAVFARLKARRRQ